MIYQRVVPVKYMLVDWEVFLGLMVLKAAGATLLPRDRDEVGGIEA